MKPPVLIYSHIRSGTTLIVAWIARSFFGEQFDNIPRRAGKTGHWSQRKIVRRSVMQAGRHLFADHYHYQRTRFEAESSPTGFLRGVSSVDDKQKKVYVVRDGRDVACSLWRTKLLLNAGWLDYPLSKFLRTPLDFYGSPGRSLRRPGPTIAEHWAAHVNGWATAPNTLFVRYEDALGTPDRCLERIGAFLRLKPKARWWPRERLGIRPHEGEVGSYKRLMTVADATFFAEHAIGHCVNYLEP